jgi:hypothetical protein
MATKDKLRLSLGILAIGLLLVPIGCRTTADDPEPDPHNAKPIVYIAGNVYKGNSSFPCYWQNGIRIDLGDIEGCGNSIFRSGNDIYVAGYQSPKGSELLPVIWKNGVAIELDRRWITRNADAGSANSVVVVDGDVYVAGYTGFSISDWSGNGVSCYWKNGVRTDLGPLDEIEKLATQTNAYSVFVSGGDVYVAGSTYIKHGGDYHFPCYWKNGTKIELPCQIEARQTVEGRALSVFVSGNDVYLAGLIETRTGHPEDRIEWFPCIWKNDIMSVLSSVTPSYYNIASSIIVSGDVVHITGTTNGSPYGYPCHWKNGVRADLSTQNAGKGGFSSSIHLLENDVYIAGASLIASVGDYPIHLPCYWKNGVRTDLSVMDANKGGRANSIFIVPGE